MGRQGSKKRRRFSSAAPVNSKAAAAADALWEDDLDDEIDAFHKQRDVIPLDAQFESGDDMEMDQPVFDLQDDDDDDDSDPSQDRGFAAKIARQAKYLKQKFGGAEDEMDEDDHQNDDQLPNNTSWGGRKNIYYDADTADLESSDEELPKEEEAEVLRIQRDKAKSLSMADLGLPDTDQDETDSDNQTQDDKSKAKSRRDTLDASYEKIKKDIGALSKEEQMDVVFSSAPELIGLLSELNESVDQLKEVKAADRKVNYVGEMGKAKMEQSEVKEALLLLYCQAISFYLLLKSEGLSVRDHPVISRLVEIKNMLKKLKEFEERFLSSAEKIADLANKADSCKMVQAQVPQQQESSVKMASGDEMPMLEDIINKQKPVKENSQQHAKQKDQDVKIGSRSLEMLKIRADLEAKLREKGLYNRGVKTKLKNSLSTKHMDGRSFVSTDDFDDEVQNAKIGSNNKLSHVAVMNKSKKFKLTSGDDDLPKRDDIGERRRKHELRVLGRIGADNNNDDDADQDNHNENDDEERGNVPDEDLSDDDASEDEFYKEAKRKHNVKLITTQQLNAAKQIVPSMDEEEEQADGKRQISYQMNKNKGLTRHRKKELKNPRKKYRAKHKKWEQRRKGQVRSIRRPSGSYGGESSGINPSVSHSVRF